MSYVVKLLLHKSFWRHRKWKQNGRSIVYMQKYIVALFPHVYEYILCVLSCCFSKPLLKKALTESHHYPSGQNECACVLNGTHLFPLRVLRQRRYPLASCITALYYTANWRRTYRVIALKACWYLVEPDSVACWSVLKPWSKAPRGRTHLHLHTHRNTNKSWVILCVGPHFPLFPPSGHSHLTFSVIAFFFTLHLIASTL